MPPPPPGPPPPPSGGGPPAQSKKEDQSDIGKGGFKLKKTGGIAKDSSKPILGNDSGTETGKKIMRTDSQMTSTQETSHLSQYSSQKIASQPDLKTTSHTASDFYSSVSVSSMSAQVKTNAQTENTGSSGHLFSSGEVAGSSAGSDDKCTPKTKCNSAVVKITEDSNADESRDNGRLHLKERQANYTPETKLILNSAEKVVNATSSSSVAESSHTITKSKAELVNAAACNSNVFDLMNNNNSTIFADNLNSSGKENKHGNENISSLFLNAGISYRELIRQIDLTKESNYYIDLSVVGKKGNHNTSIVSNLKIGDGSTDLIRPAMFIINSKALLSYLEIADSSNERVNIDYSTLQLLKNKSNYFGYVATVSTPSNSKNISQRLMKIPFIKYSINVKSKKCQFEVIFISKLPTMLTPLQKFYACMDTCNHNKGSALNLIENNDAMVITICKFNEFFVMQRT